ncbi:MAG TPA: amidohydrolase family protein [Acidimicrobiia bacterium]|nr:amidohydrolase family protein [Acidimicrobiia bacterium]
MSERGRAIDADNHYYEVDDCFSRHIEARYADRALRPVPGREPARKWMLGDRPVSFMPFNAYDQTVAPGALEKFFTGEEGKQTLTPDDYIHPSECPPMIERSARLRLLDEQGLDAIIQLPTVGMLVEPDFADQPDVLMANYRAFNRWVEDDWGYGAGDRAAGGGRIFGVPIVSMVDVDAAVAELERVAGRGARFVLLPIGPVGGQRSPADPYFDRIWAVIQETGLVPIYHVGNSGFARLFSVHWSEEPDPPLMKYSAFQQYTCVVERPISDTLAALVLHNLFGRFPGIRVMSIENGSSWVPGLLKGMDKAARMAQAMGRWLGGRLPAPPSEVFREHVYVVPFHEDDIGGLVGDLGADRVVFGSDWPHAEGLGTPLDFADKLDGFPGPVRDRIMRGNVAELVGL